MEGLLKNFTPDIVIDEITERLIGSYYKPYTCYTILGKDRMKKGRFKKAVTFFVSALALEPDNAESHYNLGYALMKSGEYSAAANHLKFALSIDPQNHNAQLHLSKILPSIKGNEKENMHLQ